MKVVPFTGYFPNLRDMDKDQIRFYEYFKNSVEEGLTLELEGYKGYIYLLSYSYLDKVRDKGFEHINEAIEKLYHLHALYKEVDFNWWIGDLMILNGKIEDALNCYYRTIQPNRTQTHAANHILNIKYHLKIDAGSTEFLCTEKKITEFAVKNINHFTEFADMVLREEKKSRGECVLQYFGKKYHQERTYALQLLGGYEGGYEIERVFKKSPFYFQTFCFYAITEFSDFCKDLSRKADNLLRDNWQMPKVGEGWISETELFYRIKNYLPSYKVIQHASPKWLGQQHLDVFIPDLLLAFEYQGRQHFEPVLFFGGDEAFERTKNRDQIKRAKCLSNKVILIEVVEGYRFEDLIPIIENQIRKVG